MSSHQAVLCQGDLTCLAMLPLTEPTPPGLSSCPLNAVILRWFYHLGNRAPCTLMVAADILKCVVLNIRELPVPWHWRGFLSCQSSGRALAAADVPGTLHTNCESYIAWDRCAGCIVFCFFFNHNIETSHLLGEIAFLLWSIPSLWRYTKTDLTLLPARMESLVEGWLLPLWTTMNLDEIDEAIVFRLQTKTAIPLMAFVLEKGSPQVSATITLVLSLGNWFLTGQNLESKQNATVPLGWEAELRVWGRWGGWLGGCWPQGISGCTGQGSESWALHSGWGTMNPVRKKVALRLGIKLRYRSSWGLSQARVDKTQHFTENTDTRNATVRMMSIESTIPQPGSNWWQTTQQSLW